MPFEHKGKAELKHINLRKGSGEDSQATVDLKFHVEGLPLSTAATALGVENPDELKRAFFHSVSEDAQESARFLGLKGVNTAGKWEGKHGITVSGFRRLRAHSVRAIELQPRAAGKFDGVVQVSIQEPPAGFVDLLMEQLGCSISINLEHDAELDLQGGTGTTAGATAAKKSTRQKAMKFSKHDTKLARKDVGRALRGNSSRRKPKAA